MTCRRQPIRWFLPPGFWRELSLFLTIFCVFLGGLGASFAADIQIVDGRGRPGPVCTVLIGPDEVQPKTSGISLKLRSVSGNDLSLLAESTQPFENLEIVIGDQRIGFAGVSVSALADLADNRVFAMIRDTRKLHVTTRSVRGEYASARFDDLDLTAIFQRMSKECGLLLNGASDKSAENLFTMSTETERLIKWLSFYVLGKKRGYGNISPDLGGSGRKRFVQAQRKLDLPPKEFLDAQSVASFLAAFGIAIAPNYENILAFREGIAPFEKGGKWGGLAVNGDVLIRPVFAEARPPVAGYMPIRQGGNWVFINHDRKRLSRARFREILACSPNVCAFRHNGRTGIIDIQNNTRKYVKFDQVGDFNEGFAPMKIGSKWHLMDETGDITIKGIAGKALSPPSGGVAVVSYTSNIKGFVDLKVSPLFNRARFLDAHPFSSRLAGAKEDGLWGFVDKRRGDFVVAPSFRAVSTFNRGLAAATQDGVNWGYIDKNGGWAIAPRYQAAGDFSEGLAVVALGAKKTLISTRGEQQAPAIFDEIRDMQDGFAAFRLGAYWGVFSKDLLRKRRQVTQ